YRRDLACEARLGDAGLRRYGDGVVALLLQDRSRGRDVEGCHRRAADRDAAELAEPDDRVRADGTVALRLDGVADFVGVLGGGVGVDHHVMRIACPAA